MNSRLKTCLLPVILVALASLSGCAGYQLGGTKPAAFAHIERIYVPTFQNRTLEPRIAANVTTAVIRQMQMDGTYEIVGNPQEADAILRGNIVDIKRRQQRSSDENVFRTEEFLILLEIDWFLEDPITGARISRADPYSIDANQRDVLTGSQQRIGHVEGRTTAFLDPNYQLAERQAIPVAAEDAAVQLVSQLAEGW